MLDDGEVLEGAVGHVGPLHAGGLERDVEGEAGIIVIGESKIDEQVEKAVRRARRLVERELDAEADELKREVEAVA